MAVAVMDGGVGRHLVVSFGRDLFDDDGLHGDDGGKRHLGDVQGTHHMTPACVW